MLQKSSIEKLSKVYNALNAIGDKSAELIMEVIRAESAPQKKGKFNIFDFVSKEKNYPVLTGVYHDGGFKVGCDGVTLAAVKDEYSEEYEGKILHKSGEFIEGVYPKWRNVIPSDELLFEKYECFEIDTEKFYTWLNDCRAEYKATYVKRVWFDANWVVKIGGIYFSSEHLCKILSYGKNILHVGEGKLVVRNNEDRLLLIAKGKSYIEDDIENYKVFCA